MLAESLFTYLQRGTLQESGSSQMRECSSKICHIRLHCIHPPGTLILQLEKWRTRDSSPLHAGKLQASWLALSTLSRGPIVRHPSLQMWTRASIASCSCKYTFFSSIFFSLSCFLWKTNNNKTIYANQSTPNDMASQ